MPSGGAGDPTEEFIVAKRAVVSAAEEEEAGVLIRNAPLQPPYIRPHVAAEHVLMPLWIQILFLEPTMPT